MLKLKFLLLIAAAAAVSAVPASEAGHEARDKVRCDAGCHPDGERLRCGDGVGIGWFSIKVKDNCWTCCRRYPWDV